MKNIKRLVMEIFTVSLAMHGETTVGEVPVIMEKLEPLVIEVLNCAKSNTENDALIDMGFKFIISYRLYKRAQDMKDFYLFLEEYGEFERALTDIVETFLKAGDIAEEEAGSDKNKLRKRLEGLETGEIDLDEISTEELEEMQALVEEDIEEILKNAEAIITEKARRMEMCTEDSMGSFLN